MVIVNWCGHAQEFGPWPKADGYWTRLPVIDADGEEGNGGGPGEPGLQCHWMTSSARPSSDGGMVRPRAFAVLRLNESVNRVGRSIGISLGGVPARILTAIVPAWAYI